VGILRPRRVAHRNRCAHRAPFAPNDRVSHASCASGPL
jgi:hypothetical protein